ncbi:MAG: 5-dehydro-2-deoxygluconokinase [Hyphomicrobiales bacterium]|nr:5-dehydro-2-deoxygluconokinase [Hyphomicrobiales bacterium]
MRLSSLAARSSGRESNLKFEKIRQNRFLVLGRAGMDLYADPPGTRTEEAERFTASLGGSAANIAAAIVKLGGSASLITAVSDDAVGRYTVNQLRGYGIGTEYVSTVAGDARNSLAVVETRIENCQSVIYRNGAADFLLADHHVATVDFAAHGALIVTGTCLAMEPSRAATFLAIELAKSEELPIIFDIDYRPYSWASAEDAAATCTRAASLSDIVVGNDVEFAVMAGNSDGLKLARILADTTANSVVYKMGEKGSIAFSGAQSFETSIFAVTALKPTGAGDAFMGGLATGLAEGHALAPALRRGTAAAAIVVSRVGCAPAMPTSGELKDFLDKQLVPA